MLQGVTPNNAFFTLDIDGNGTCTNSVDVSVSYGLRYDLPVTGQWGSTKRSQIGVFRDGSWSLDVDGDYVWNSTVDRALTFGGAGDTPVVFVRH